MKGIMGMTLSYCLVAAAVLVSASLVAGEIGLLPPGAGHIEVVTVLDMEIDAHVLKNVNEGTLAREMPTGKFMVPINVILLRDGEGVMLIDAGIGNGIVARLEQRGLSAKDVRRVFLTHMHFDHIDGLVGDGAPVFPNATIYLSRQEYGHWSDKTNIASYPVEDRETMQGAFDKCAAVLAAYDGKIELFNPSPLGGAGVELAPGVAAVATFGHTPGHTSYLVGSAGKTIFVTGDEILSGDLQFAKPEITSIFDADQAAAAETRMKVFDFLSRSAIPFTSMHNPGIGILAHGDGGDNRYVFQPIEHSQ